MAYEELPTAVLTEQLDSSAAAFSVSLQNIAVVIDAEISQVIRKGVFDVFKEIVKRSPVDTGAYRASHGIANMDPSSEDGIVKGRKGSIVPPSVALAKGTNWTWKVGDGDIFLYNNLPYAERIENGWSQNQAPEGVYRVALASLTQSMNQELAKMQTLVSTGGE